MKAKSNDKISDYKEPNNVDGSATKKFAIAWESGFYI